MRSHGNQSHNQHRQITGARGGFASAGGATMTEQWDQEN